MALTSTFISFDYDHDEDLRNLLVGQAKNSDTPFWIADQSVKEPFTGDWKTKVRRRIKGVDVVVVVCGQYTHPDRVRPERFQLIAPHEPNPRRWLKMPWIDRYSGKTFRIATRGHHGGPSLARVQTYGDVIESYEYHPEAKFADALGEPCRKETVGLLQRRRVRIGLLTNIGKESNSLEEVQAGLVHDEENVYTTYDDSSRGYWQTAVLPAVRQAPLAMLVKACEGKLSRRALIDIRAGRSTPHRKNQELLRALLRSLGLL